MFYPQHAPAPGWVEAFCTVVADARPMIDSREVDGLTSDGVLVWLRGGLESIGFQVEVGKKATDKIRRPVLFGESGKERIAYEVDGFHPEYGVVLEVEAGRGARGNAVYRDLIRASLLVDARFLALGVMNAYRHQSGGREITVRSFDDAVGQLDAIYASGRLGLPFDGILLFGY